jgi:hypothetical protein
VGGRYVVALLYEFQPFLRFWPEYRRRLIWSNGMLMFQPFLRFWTAKDNLPLLEILNRKLDELINPS